MSEMRTNETVQSGTLRLLLNRVRPTDYADEMQMLSWAGFPPDASFGDTLADAELGDEECAPFPSQPPAERGLWLLEWAWRLVPCEDWEGHTTARYAATCVWRRPTIADLIALEALPA